MYGGGFRKDSLFLQIGDGIEPRYYHICSKETEKNVIQVYWAFPLSDAFAEKQHCSAVCVLTRPRFPAFSPFSLPRQHGECGVGVILCKRVQRGRWARFRRPGAAAISGPSRGVLATTLQPTTWRSFGLFRYPSSGERAPRPRNTKTARR